MKKKLVYLIINIAILISILLVLPVKLYADPVIYTDGNVEMKITPGYYNESNTFSLKYNANVAIGSETMVWMAVGYWNPSYQQIGTLGRTYHITGYPYEFSMSGNITNVPNLEYHVQIYYTNGSGTVINEWMYSLDFALTDNPNPTTAPTVVEPVWVRTMPMTCYQVWVNEDNKFQFVFWYPYRDNNWVRIYDMNDKMVYEIDMPYDNPNLIVDLPDGMYTVKTFTVGSTEPIQTFVIGK